ncbi:hypothetical protein [Nostoc sp. DSM 114159]
MTTTNSYSKNFDRGSGTLQGKTAIQTSSNSGIGLAVALTFLVPSLRLGMHSLSL